MPKTVKNAIWFDSADGRSVVAGYTYEDPDAAPWCVLQISHGMCEHMNRYDDFAGFLAASGVAVCGNDHIGHGASVGESEDYGYFSEKHGRRFALADLRRMNRRAREKWPGLPVVLLGHSMGSFFARKYAADWPEDLDGLIISGTGGPNPLAGVGIALANTIAAVRGPRHRSALLHYMTFGSYLGRIKNPAGQYDWVSADPDTVRDYSEDERCTFRFTANGFHELYNALKDVSSPGWAVKIRKDMPVLMIQGGQDPVGDYGRGTAKVRDWLRGAGVKNLEYILYPEGRHEMLNEVNRREVYSDVLAFLTRWWNQG